MTKLAVPIFVSSLEQALAAAARAAELGADLVEFRVDQFASPGDLPQIAPLIERSALPCIITCRPTWEGGLYDGDDQERISLLEHAGLAARTPAYIDVELAAYQRSANLRQKVELVVDHPGQVRPTSTGLILSAHDFEGRPKDLYQRIEAMAASSACRVIKVAWKARSLRDNVEAMELIRQRHKPTIALCMGEYGLASRVLARKFGALLTFASLDRETGTAPGQPTVQELKQLYRWDALGPQTRVYGVIGFPVGHSMSPAIHNAGFTATGFDGVYLPMPIPPEYEHFKATAITWLEAADLDFKGASVTIPHKENLLRFVKEQGGEIEELAQRIGAANTLTVREDGSLYASNTDYAAALDAVCDPLHQSRADLAGQRVAVIGAGGAARAVVAGLAHYGANVVIYNRTAAKAQALAEEFSSGKGQVTAQPLEKLRESRCQIYVNCTPMGMSPHTERSPLDQEAEAEIRNPKSEIRKEESQMSWGPGTVVFDTIYNPIETKFLRQARAAGCMTIPGTEMFVRQAAAQFELWTGRKAPTEVFDRVLREKLGGK